MLAGAALLLTMAVRVLLWMFFQSSPSGLRRRYVPGAFVRLLTGLTFLVAAHGSYTILPLLLTLVFFLVSRFLAGTRAAVPTVWTLSLAAIFLTDEKLPMHRQLKFKTVFGKSWAFLDKWGGMYGWTHSVNLMLLRLMSFALDCHSAKTRAASSFDVSRTAAGIGSAHAAVMVFDEKLHTTSDHGSEPVHAAKGTAEVVETSSAPNRYSLMHCLSHTFYAPLFIAGPTIGFDDYMEQCEQPRTSNTHLGWYLLQLAAALITLEVATHLYPCFALARSGMLQELGPRLGAAAVFLTLNMMWLKFFIIWRVARAWALLEGIDVPENMTRALCDHYSMAGFWKCWHASFNRWLVRYLYVPFGGRDRRILAASATFFFVALWHDIEVKLLAWGALNAVFVSLETIVTSTWRRRGADLAASQPWLHRQIGALAGTTYIMVLMGVNMLGYSVGVGGISGLLASAATTYSEALWVLAGAYAIIFSAVQVMFEIRHMDGSIPREVPPSTRAGVGSTASRGEAKKD